MCREAVALEMGLTNREDYLRSRIESRDGCGNHGGGSLWSGKACISPMLMFFPFKHKGKKRGFVMFLMRILKSLLFAHKECHNMVFFPCRSVGLEQHIR